MNKKTITLFLLVLMALSATIVPVSAYDPFVTVSMDKSVVNEGEIITFTGISEGSATIIQFFLIGDTWQECTTHDLTSDKTFEVTVNTDGLQQGTYYVIISNPNTGDECAITFSYDDDPFVYYNDKSQGRLSTFKGANGAQKITNLLSRSDCDDVFLKTSFYVINPQPTTEPTDTEPTDNTNTLIGAIALIVICIVLLGICAIPFIVYNLPKNNKDNSETQQPTETSINSTVMPVGQPKAEAEVHEEGSGDIANNGVDEEKGGFCPECGKPYKIGSQFCKYCGRKL